MYEAQLAYTTIESKQINIKENPKDTIHRQTTKQYNIIQYSILYYMI